MDKLFSLGEWSMSDTHSKESVWTAQYPKNFIHASVGEKVEYIGYTWKVIDILPHGSRVLHRPWWKLRKTGVVIA